MVQEFGIITIQGIADRMIEHGDERNRTAIEMQIRRALERGEFPSATKLRDNTSNWIISVEEADDWLCSWLESREDDDGDVEQDT